MSHCLHICNQSPFESQHLKQAIELAMPEQALVLIENGVYGALANAPVASQLQSSIGQGLKCYVLECDLSARGLGEPAVGIKAISMTEFVELTSQHSPIQSWY